MMIPMPGFLSQKRTDALILRELSVNRLERTFGGRVVLHRSAGPGRGIRRRAAAMRSCTAPAARGSCSRRVPGDAARTGAPGPRRERPRAPLCAAHGTASGRERRRRGHLRSRVHAAGYVCVRLRCVPRGCARPAAQADPRPRCAEAKQQISHIGDMENIGLFVKVRQYCMRQRSCPLRAYAECPRACGCVLPTCAVSPVRMHDDVEAVLVSRCSR